MTPDEVVQACYNLGIKVHRRTLLTYESKGLIPPAVRTGKSAHYPAETVQLVVKANLLNKYSGLIVPIIKLRFPNVYEELAETLENQFIKIGGGPDANIQRQTEREENRG